MYTAVFFWQDEVAIREYVVLPHHVRVYCCTIILCEKLLHWQGKCCIKGNYSVATVKVLNSYHKRKIDIRCKIKNKQNIYKYIDVLGKMR